MPRPITQASWKNFLATLMAGVMLAAPIAASAQDRDGGRNDRRNDNSQGNNRNGRGDNDRSGDNRFQREGRGDNNQFGRDGRGNWRGQWNGERHFGGQSRVIVVQHPIYTRSRIVPRVHYWNNMRIYRPYGQPYAGFGFYYSDRDAWRFLAFTALSLAVMNQLSENQQRAHEAAFVDATNAPIGESIYWNDGPNEGSVTPVREGHTVDGRSCREFRQDVTIGGKNTEAYGTACQQGDGSWEIVNQ